MDLKRARRKSNRQKIDLIGYLIKVATLFIIYFITAIFGLNIEAVSGFATLVWLPTGISLALLLIFGYKLWPAIFLGAFFANLFTGASMPVAVGIGIGNTFEALIAAYLLQRFFDFHNTLDRLRDVISLVFIAALLSTAISASVGVTSLYLGGTVSASELGQTWLAWWVGDMISNLITAPLILVWYSYYQRKLNYNQLAELALAIAYLLISIFFVFFFDIIKNPPFTFLIFPPLIWISLRFTQRETVTAILFVAIIALYSTLQGSGPFARQSATQNLILLQSFMTVTSITFMILSAIVAERRKLEKIKDDLLTIISHELKTPVTSIKAYTQLLKKQFTVLEDRQTVKYLGRMDAQIDKLTAMINDLLDLSRIQDQKLQLQKKPFSLQILIREVVENIQTTNRTHKIIVRGTATKKVNADRVRIEQVMTNLLSNAVKYSPNKKKVIVSVKNQAHKIIIGVKDYGIGIDEKFHDKVFERFFRVQEGVTQTGFGIGLYLSREIIARHGGQLWVESKPNKGSTFYFSLPYS